jgi:uncharacterized Tic20 family protein/DNA-binding XRE family transcriptional regulator
MNQPELGKKIVELRKQKGLTQEDLALECGFNVRTIQRFENGEVEPRPKNLKILSDILNFQFNGSNEKDPLGWLIGLHLTNIFPIVIPALLIWIFKKDEFHGVKKHGIDVINFQISMCIYLFVSSILIIVVVGIFTNMALGIYITVITIINIIRIASGKEYNYHLTIKIIK